MFVRFIMILLVALTVGTTVSAEQVSLDPYVELLRSDVRAKKVAIIIEVMKMTDEESSIFWPIYREYELELNKLLDARLALIKDYASTFDSMTDEQAKDLADKVFKMEEQRTKLKKKYFDEVAKALSPVIAAKFTQVENQLNMLIDLQIVTNLPLIK